MPTRPGRKTSLYLPADLADRADASDLSLAQLVARGLDCTGHHADPIGRLQAGHDDLAARVRELERQAGMLAGEQAAQWLADLGTMPVTAADAAGKWGLGTQAATRRLRKLVTAGTVEQLSAVKRDRRSPGTAPRRYRVVSREE